MLVKIGQGEKDFPGVEAYTCFRELLFAPNVEEELATAHVLHHKIESVLRGIPVQREPKLSQ